MEIHQAQDALPIINQALDLLLAYGPVRGRSGSELRMAIGALKTYGLDWLYGDSIWPHVDASFELARRAGVTREQFGNIRREIQQTKPLYIGAIVMRDCIIELCLATEARIIVDMRFVARHQIEELRKEMNDAFNKHEEEIADDQDSLAYRALIALHAAVIMYLTEIARPLPRMVRYHFHRVMPSLVMGHRLYGDAKRADELRLENKVIHPAFMLMTGRALSS